MTHPVVLAIGVGAAIGIAIFAYLMYEGPSGGQQQRQRQHAAHRYERPIGDFIEQASSRRRGSGEATAGDQPRMRRRASFEKTCTICLEETAHDLARVACGHYFHLGCLARLHGNVCPNCRADL